MIDVWVTNDMTSQTDDWKSKTQRQHQIEGINFADDDDDSGDGERSHKVATYDHDEIIVSN